MWLISIILLLFIEVLTFLILKEHLSGRSKNIYYLSLSINFFLSIWFWFMLIKVALFRGFFDEPAHITAIMNQMGLVCGIIFPRIVLIVLHYLGKLLKLRKGGYIPWLTRTGFIIATLISFAVASATFHGRYNLKKENVVLRINELSPGLDGFKIVQISDLHLSSFYKHDSFLKEIVDTINACRPDIIINTGDFITFGWREFNSFDTILSKEKSRYGNFAVLGNHDMGTYFPGATEADMQAIINKVDTMMTASGYRVLNNESVMLDIRGSKLEITGIRTSGRHFQITESDPLKALLPNDTADFKILLSHDPNQWDRDVVGRTDINLTFAGHTHGMQMGIVTNKFRWSPAQYFYSRWNGLYSKTGQYIYVNRGLGVLAVPFRIWMPPEITVLTLISG